MEWRWLAQGPGGAVACVVVLTPGVLNLRLFRLFLYSVQDRTTGLLLPLPPNVIQASGRNAQNAISRLPPFRFPSLISLSLSLSLTLLSLSLSLPLPRRQTSLVPPLSPPPPPSSSAAVSSLLLSASGGLQDNAVRPIIPQSHRLHQASRVPPPLPRRLSSPHSFGNYACFFCSRLLVL